MSVVNASSLISSWPSFENMESLNQKAKAVYDLRDGIKLYDCTQNKQIQVKDDSNNLESRICFLVRPMFFCISGERAPDSIIPILFESPESEDPDMWIRTTNSTTNKSKIEYGKMEPFTCTNQTSFIVTQDFLQPDKENIVEFFEYKSASLEAPIVQGRRWHTNGTRSHYPFACIFASLAS